MKKRSDWKSMAPNHSILLMKSTSILLCIILYSVIYMMDSLTVIDFVALALFILGASLVRAAKTELVKNDAFTWTGYVLDKPNLVTSGIYKFVRHPLYLGVYCVEFGGAFIGISRTHLWFPEYYFWVNTALVLGIIYAIVFNALLAGKESKNLRNIFGEEYSDYQKKVPAIVPFF
ncbi:MAG: protein-S-isoprenylcysteine O-methyltransferase Ste14 [Bermanella sp.]|jgi:protein-S-isoprenylcysteine O-methyltransferase Ste14